ncbi:MarR family winged helix-turn-helix transcriptional regulator [Aquamicrobium defluvii]|uniref:MarR family transcriptional regulator n=1 Tax=Aquamicrobium defluvii TaxID=69279 RepID=A0A011U5V9_9HYPH|nr:MarR family transcriptional regulator [Aquamicrobium defluvii]EXL01486.1 MarR family transcriptional regulator [Aquamicrobium defluvii]EZQ12729.1 MarR family transcriptional regulator [Halopseudomonas bauzanensis]
MAKLKLESFLPYRLNRISGLISLDFRSVYGRHHDLTVPEWRVLATLGEFEEMSAKAIGAHSFMHKTKVSRAVRALEERRWLKRRESQTDRREEILGLTVAGRQAYAEIVPRAIEFEAALLAALGTDAKYLLKALGRLETYAGMGGKGGSRSTD